MDEVKGFTEELQATVIYSTDNKPSVITFLIGEYVITIDTARSGAAYWDYLENCISEDAFIPSF